MKTLLPLIGHQPLSRFTCSICPDTSRGSCGRSYFNVSSQLRDSDVSRAFSRRAIKSASYIERHPPSSLGSSLSLPEQFGSAVAAVLLGFPTATAYAETGEVLSVVPENTVSATTAALTDSTLNLSTDSVPAPIIAENSDAANVVISVLLTSAFVGLVVLTLGVAYLAVTEWQDKTEREKLAVGALEEQQKKKNKKPPGSSTPTRKPRGFGSK